MVKVDLVKMELIAENMARLSSDSEDALGKLRQINNEMSYDNELLLNPQGQFILQNLSDSINSLMVADDMLLSLKQILQSLPEEYGQLEERWQTEMTRWGTKLEKVSGEVEQNITKILPGKKEEKE